MCSQGNSNKTGTLETPSRNASVGVRYVVEIELSSNSARISPRGKPTSSAYVGSLNRVKGDRELAAGPTTRLNGVSLHKDSPKNLFVPLKKTTACGFETTLGWTKHDRVFVFELNFILEIHTFASVRQLNFFPLLNVDFLTCTFSVWLSMSVCLIPLFSVLIIEVSHTVRRQLCQHVLCPSYNSPAPTVCRICKA